jgi:hypothetical protein
VCLHFTLSISVSLSEKQPYTIGRVPPPLNYMHSSLSFILLYYMPPHLPPPPLPPCCLFPLPSQWFLCSRIWITTALTYA